ncbi:hypothetical protein C8035_v004272 [Colletotrichum spinosum]|uniref:MARVEL domain-containing protein n=1 Tax=Colletotrichum spinosum TaxID=1347390 RepID=A0A4R8PVN6_9PEZI|nr:hypothetical protein C8035_v004272 [Colletotrichum spinosum]
MQQVQYSNQRPAGREHVPLYPKGFIALRIVQLVLAVVITGICAFGVYILPFSGNCFMIFVSLSTIIVTVWLVVAEYAMPKIYNLWAVLALDIFLLVFWLCSFGLLASQSAFLFGSAVCDYYGYCYSYSVVLSSCMAAAAGLGGLEFALFITSLSIHSVMLHRHRKAGLHSSPESSSSASSGAVAPVVASQTLPEKNAGVQVTNAAYQPAHQGQSAPPYGHQEAAYGGQMAPQQAYHPGAQQQQQQQQMYAQAPVQQHQMQPQQQQQQQNYYPQQAPTPLSAQNTGGSFVQMQPQQGAPPPMPPAPNAHEVSGNVYPSHQ